MLCDRSVSILEAVTEWLKEKKRENYRRIGLLLNRDERTIWTCYSRAKKKRATQKPAVQYLRSIDIPISVFRNRLFSSLEVLVVYLKEKRGMNYREIGLLLNRNERTIWTCYSRAKKKMQGGDSE